ncbi:MAG: histidinol-phosphate transaminase [Acidimicrobiales bacterium]|jgi:histidinol-phosphate aminotransferase|nr:histidinol-phosphate transaminase [Acidimicrobiales bacterium]
MTTAGRPRPAVDALPAYRPGKDAAQAEEEHGISDAIKLASNENPWPPVPTVATAIAEAAAGVNRYADHRASVLRAELARSLSVDAEQVTVGCGSVGLLQQLCLTYVDPGDEVVYPWRSFEVYPVFTQLVGGRAVTVPLREHAFDLDAVADAVTDRTKLVFLATPNNPTGTSVSSDDLNRFADRVGPGTVIVIDEAYREFNDAALGDPVTDVLPNHPHTVVLRTFSKAHGLAGLRVGYMVGSPPVVEAVDKTLFPFAVNAIAQAAAIAAIAADAEVAERVDVLRAERDRVASALGSDGNTFVASEGNFVWMPLGDRTDDVYIALEKLGVVTRPFSGEGIRVTIGTADQNDRFLAALSNVDAR